MRISYWSSDVCSSDLVTCQDSFSAPPELGTRYAWASAQWGRGRAVNLFESRKFCRVQPIDATSRPSRPEAAILARRSEEHTSELQSLMRISYAVFCLKTKQHTQSNTHHTLDLDYT